MTAFGAGDEDAALCREEFERHEFTYARLSEAERDKVILGILERLDHFTHVGAHRHQIWTDSWAEVADRYDRSGGDIAALDPPFIGASTVVRLRGNYVETRVPRFELN